MSQFTKSVLMLLLQIIGALLLVVLCVGTGMFLGMFLGIIASAGRAGGQSGWLSQSRVLGAAFGLAGGVLLTVKLFTGGPRSKAFRTYPVLEAVLNALLGILLVGGGMLVGTAGGCLAGAGVSKMSGSDFGPMLVGGWVGAVFGLAGGVFLAVKLLAGKSR